MAVKLGRRFVGIELKPEYAAVAAKNLREIETVTLRQLSMFGARGENPVAQDRG